MAIVMVSGASLVNQQMAAEAASLRAAGYGVAITPAKEVRTSSGAEMVGYVIITSVPTPNPDGYTVGYPITFSAPLEVAETETAATSPESTTAAPTNGQSTTSEPTSTEPTTSAPTNSEPTTAVAPPFASRWFTAFMAYLSFGDAKL
jgi:hypothetical protein